MNGRKMEGHMDRKTKTDRKQMDRKRTGRQMERKTDRCMSRKMDR